MSSSVQEPMPPASSQPSPLRFIHETLAKTPRPEPANALKLRPCGRSARHMLRRFDCIRWGAWCRLFGIVVLVWLAVPALAVAAEAPAAAPAMDNAMSSAGWLQEAFI